MPDSIEMPTNVLHRVDESDPVARSNIFRPKAQGRYPVLLTYSPYGKDIPYSKFNPASYNRLPKAAQTPHAVWEAPDPTFWVPHGYVVVRVDERGSGHSPGVLNVWSEETACGFADAIEWAAVQPWSNGKVGLLGVSYYASNQWFVAARRPKGLSAILPWEGVSNFYDECARHGGIMSNGFIGGWWPRQIGSNQYGLNRDVDREWSMGGTREANLTPEMASKRRDMRERVANAPFRDDPVYAVDTTDLGNIECPVLSVANWGASSLHLRGSVLGFLKAGSKHKFLHFIVGRHDTPFFEDYAIRLQKSFLDAFLKGQDTEGWSTGSKPSVDLCVRRGNPGVNDEPAEIECFPRRPEAAWPIERTQYTKMYLGPPSSLSWEKSPSETTVQYRSPSSYLAFRSQPFPRQTEITGHPSVRLSISLAPYNGSSPSDIDIFVALRHIDVAGKEICYTGANGQAEPVVRGYLRVSQRHRDHETDIAKRYPVIPMHTHKSTDVLPVALNEVYTVDVELWPTSVVIEKGEVLELTVSAQDIEQRGQYTHDHPNDRPVQTFQGFNIIHFGPDKDNFLTLPIIRP
ncbi:hypothetical protein M409DRAFT_68510 [Zasmidium cellare ATCC 36951]|uniref:Xaa-Pro dipeptidyl-peptidase C-terminal domain-containing protein n=1 Tax=Zasmidium cellare ATCC 36951 TaxID=1080233 RepID=A0A6A6C8V6_ZASCE|nr:uncharacterized protein M409DRAFT_68510 [Zasmidium cellare ATCC 36951]KAF2163617.1 hypothetical protein M409DRAFT_68510 [Zasmidium cellare ATCC 36951]